MPAIVPTLGRVMIFVPVWDYKHHNGFNVQKGQRYRCDVIDETGSDTVARVSVTDRMGNSYAFTARVRQADDPIPNEHYVEWMQYQVGQAAKNDSDVTALKQQVADLRGEVISLSAEVVELRGKCQTTTTEDDFYTPDDTDLLRAADDGMKEPTSIHDVIAESDDTEGVR